MAFYLSHLEMQFRPFSFSTNNLLKFWLTTLYTLIQGSWLHQNVDLTSVSIIYEQYVKFIAAMFYDDIRISSCCL